MNPVTVVGQSTSDHLFDVQELVSIITGEQFNTGNVHHMIQTLFSQVRFPPILSSLGYNRNNFNFNLFQQNPLPPQNKLYK